MGAEDSSQRDERSRGGDTVSDLANALLDNPVFSQALATALGVGERAAQAQKSVMDAVGLPSAEELARLERRIRSLSDRLESVEDQLDRVAADVRALGRQLDDRTEVSADQESLRVTESE